MLTVRLSLTVSKHPPQRQYPTRLRLGDDVTNRQAANRLFTKGAVTYMSPTRMSRIESAIRIVLEFNEAFNRHDVAGMMQIMSDDCVFENTRSSPRRLCVLGEGSSHSVLAGLLPRVTAGPHRNRGDFWLWYSVHYALEIRVGGCGRKKGTCPRSRYIPGEERFHLRKVVLRQGIVWIRKTRFHHRNTERTKRQTISARSELGFWKLGL